MRTRVKICGFTRPEDARAAAMLGVDAIGLVFYPPSPRNVDIEQAREIIDVLPAFVTVVGLFVDELPDRVREVVSRVALDLLQFHGDEAAAYCEGFGKPYIKAVRMNRDTDLLGIARNHRAAKGLLLDADSRDAKGGTGHAFDWALIPEDCPSPIILAGGLNRANVVEALEHTQSFAVDVSSGVESSKGIKDARKMAAFLKEVDQYDYGQR